MSGLIPIGFSHLHPFLGCCVCLCLQHSPRHRGECDFQTLETTLEIPSSLLYSLWWSRAPCSCAITIPHGSSSHSPYGVALGYIFICINVLPVFSPLHYQAVMRPSGFAHLAGVCSLLYLLALLP